MQQPCTLQDQTGSTCNEPEIFECGAQYLFPALLPLLVTDLQDVAHEGSVPLAVGQLVRVHVTNCTNDALCQGVLVQLQLAQKLNCACSPQKNVSEM